jgi:hypothetical protein
MEFGGEVTEPEDGAEEEEHGQERKQQEGVEEVVVVDEEGEEGARKGGQPGGEEDEAFPLIEGYEAMRELHRQLQPWIDRTFGCGNAEGALYEESCWSAGEEAEDSDSEMDEDDGYETPQHKRTKGQGQGKGGARGREPSNMDLRLLVHVSQDCLAAFRTQTSC